MQLSKFFIIFFTSFCIIPSGPLFGDDALRRSNLDTAANYFSKSKALLKENLDSARYWTRKALSIYLIEKDSQSMANAYSRLGLISKLEGNYIASLRLQDSSIQLFLSNHDTTGILKGYRNKAVVYDRLSQEQDAIDHYKKAVDLGLQFSEKSTLAKTYNGIANFYTRRENYKEAIKHYNEALSHYTTAHDTSNHIKVLQNLGMVYILKTELDSAQSYLEQCHALIEASDDSISHPGFSLVYGQLLYENTEYEKAEKVLRNGIAYSIALNNHLIKAKLYSVLLGLYIEQGDHLELKTIIPKAEMALASISADQAYQISLLDQLSQSYFALNIYNKAYEYLKLHASMQDSLNSEIRIDNSKSLQNQLSILQKDYDIERLENQVKLENKEKQLMWSWIIGSVLIILLLIVTTIYFREKHKKQALLNEQDARLHSQEVERLIDQSERDSLSALIKGQNEERYRLAQELHDNVGSMLASIMMKLNHDATDVEKGVVIPSQEFKETQSLLNNSYIELRKITHDISPTLVLKLGLYANLEDLLRKLEIEAEISVKFQSNLDGVKLEDSVELNLYRITQELITNVHKHAHPSRVELSCILGQDQNIDYLFFDDGVGFNDTNQFGLGISNIQDRVRVMKGKFSIKSERKEGSTISITIPYRENEEENKAAIS